MKKRRTNKRIKTVIALIMAVTGWVACSEMNAYESLVTKELAKNKRVDSLFLGISFGMTSKEFYTHCWELNKNGLITDGSNNTMVLYKIDSALKYPASMNFYPDFYENKIYKMRVKYQYDAWAPWNKQLYADSMMPRVLNLLMHWYGGNPFLTITDSLRGTIYVKVDGNRRITVGKSSVSEIKTDFTDLLIEKQLIK